MADLTIFVPLMESHPSPSTMTAAWLKPSQGSQDFGTLSMTSLSMTVIPNNTQPMSYNSYNDVQTNTSHSTLINANSARLRSPLQDSGYLPKVTKLITQLQMPYPSSQSLPTGWICILFLGWSISSHPVLVTLHHY